MRISDWSSDVCSSDLALVLDGDAGERDVDLLGLQGGNDAVEVHRLQRVGDADLLGDGIPHVDVEADVLVALLELEGNEGGIRGDDEVGGAAGLAGGRDGRPGEGCENEFT